MNLGFKGSLRKIDDSEVPREDEVPESSPKSSGEGFQPRRQTYQSRFRGGREGYKRRF